MTVRRAGRALGRLAGAVVLLTSGGAAALSPAAANASSGTPGYCPTDEGVTVVVDFQELGGGIVVRCAPGPVVPGFSGLDALQGTGFEPEGVRRYGLAFVCRISAEPGPDRELPIDGDPHYKEACVNTPPVSAFWSYWYAPDRGTWTYSDVAAINHDAIRGGFEGWSFSLNHAGAPPPPGIAPRRPPTVPPTTPPPTSPPTQPPPSPPTSPPTHRPPTRPPPTHPPSQAPTSRQAPGHPGGPTTHPGPTPTAQPSAGVSPGAQSTGFPTTIGSSGAGGSPQSRTTHPGRGPGPPTVDSPSPITDPVAAGHNAAGERVSGELPGDTSTPGGSVRTLVVGLGLVALLAGGGAVAAWRRRADRG